MTFPLLAHHFRLQASLKTLEWGEIICDSAKKRKFGEHFKITEAHENQKINN